MTRSFSSLEAKQTWLRERQAASLPVEPPQTGEAPIWAQRHYSVAEVARMWNLSTDAVRRLFERELGVLMIGDVEGRAGKRRYVTLRIPESVLERVHRKLSRVSAG